MPVVFQIERHTEPEGVLETGSGTDSAQGAVIEVEAHALAA